MCSKNTLYEAILVVDLDVEKTWSSGRPGMADIAPAKV